MLLRRALLPFFLPLLFSPVLAQAPYGFPDSTVASDSLNSAATARQVRGYEQQESHCGEGLRRTVHSLLTPPRIAIDLLLRSAAVSAVFLDESRIIQKFSDVFLIYNNRLGWYPVIDFASGFDPAFGLTLFYRDNYFRARIKGGWANSDIWFLRANTSYTFFAGGRIWQITAAARSEKNDNLRFYGIGADPQSDNRSHFRADAIYDYGRFEQVRSLLELGIGLRPSPDWELFYNISFIHRQIDDPSSGDDVFSRIFDITGLAGFDDHNLELYNEIALRLDSRENLRLILPGVRAEVYSGISLGLDDDPGRVVRSGMDFSAFWPVYAKSRFLIPRLVFDSTIPLNDSLDFVDYARQPAFRGKSRSELLRNDRYSLLGSLEYFWPLTYHIDGALFTERLLVARRLAAFSLRDAPWVYGLQLDFHNQYSELARVYVGYGSEGFLVKLNVGFDTRYRDRAEWK